ncbi:shikimate dehydrogenase, partial [Candidatus Bathyarchaeota archaeon]|nr:shikimate dehydrogenase [Candidatus Bathyarchaeota archaeon]
PTIGESPVDVGLLRPDLMVFDVIYNPPKTKLLKEAEAIGARTLNGLDMLIYQGAEAFRLWTGREAPIPVMRRAVEEALGIRT